MTMCFMFAWRNSAVHLTAHLNWNREQLELRNQQLQESLGTADAMVYLYKSILTKICPENSPNACRIEQFKDVMDCVEEFVLSNIQELAFLRLNQTEYKDVIKKMKAIDEKRKPGAKGLSMH